MRWRRLNLVSRVRSWKDNVFRAIVELQQTSSSLGQQLHVEQLARKANEQALLTKVESLEAQLAELRAAADRSTAHIARVDQVIGGDGEAQRELADRLLELFVEHELLQTDFLTIKQAMAETGVGAGSFLADVRGLESALLAKIAEQGAVAEAREENRDQIIASMQALLSQNSAAVAALDYQLQALSTPAASIPAVYASAAALEALSGEFAVEALARQSLAEGFLEATTHLLVLKERVDDVADGQAALIRQYAETREQLTALVRTLDEEVSVRTQMSAALELLAPRADVERVSVRLGQQLSEMRDQTTALTNSVAMEAASRTSITVALELLDSDVNTELSRISTEVSDLKAMQGSLAVHADLQRVEGGLAHRVAETHDLVVALAQDLATEAAERHKLSVAFGELAVRGSAFDAGRIEAVRAEYEELRAEIAVHESALVDLTQRVQASSGQPAEPDPAYQAVIIELGASIASLQQKIEGMSSLPLSATPELTALVAHLQSVSAALGEQIAEAKVMLTKVEEKQRDLQLAVEQGTVESAHLFRAMAHMHGANGSLLALSPWLYLNERGNAAIVVASQLENRSLQSGDVPAIVDKLATGALSRLLITEYPPESGVPRLREADELIPLFAEITRAAARVFHRGPPPEHTDTTLYSAELETLESNPFAVEAVVAGHIAATGAAPVPYDKPALLPEVTYSQVRRRSAIFLHNNYYHFNVLADALRKRGWDAMTVSVESPTSPQRQFYHGEDLNLFDTNYDVMQEKVRAFLSTVPERFGALHFYGAGQASFFPEHHQSGANPTKLPWDFFELRRHRMTIGYMPSGCLDGARQSDIRRITNGLCRDCVWERRPDVCSDARATAWADRLDAVCDWVGLECDWVVGRRTGAKFVRGPVVTTLDPDTWTPQLPIPEDLRIAREENEILIYHAVGNYEVRRRAKRDIKGTGAIMSAVETLREEGFPVRLIFFTDVPSTMIKYYQAQADIVVDQLRYGRYGANARECLMLGRPVVGWIDGRQEDRDDVHPALRACPIVNANVDTITDQLRKLVKDRRLREDVGLQSRKFAIQWHGADVCAERFERIIDRIKQGLPADSPDLYPPADTFYPSGSEDADAPKSVVRSSRVAAARVSANRPPANRTRGG